MDPALAKKAKQVYVHTRGLVSEVFSGEFKSAFRGTGMEFEEFREYVPGDEIRRIDWNVTARMGRPFIKTFREERERTLILAVDVSASVFFGSGKRPKREMIAELASVLTLAAEMTGDRVGLLLYSDRVEKFIPPKKGKSQVWRVIRELLSFVPQGKNTHAAIAWNFLGRVLKRRSVCFVISDFIDKTWQEGFRFLASKHDVLGVVVSDPLEKSFPKSALISLKDLETGEVRWIDAASKEFLITYEKLQTQRTQTIEKAFIKQGVDGVFLDSGEDYFRQFLKFLKKRNSTYARHSRH